MVEGSLFNFSFIFSATKRFYLDHKSNDWIGIVIVTVPWGLNSEIDRNVAFGEEIIGCFPANRDRRYGATCAAGWWSSGTVGFLIMGWTWGSPILFMDLINHSFNPTSLRHFKVVLSMINLIGFKLVLGLMSFKFISFYLFMKPIIIFFKIISIF